MNSGDFSFHKFILEQKADDLEAFAERAGTTVSYLKRHLIHKTRLPRIEMIETLVSASNGAFTKVQFVAWLYGIDSAYFQAPSENMTISGGVEHAAKS